MSEYTGVHKDYGTEVFEPSTWNLALGTVITWYLGLYFEPMQYCYQSTTWDTNTSWNDHITCHAWDLETVSDCNSQWREWRVMDGQRTKLLFEQKAMPIQILPTP